MQLALSTTIAPPPLPVWDELSGNLRQGITTKKQGWNPGPNVVNSTTQIGLQASLFLEGVRQSHRARYYNPITGRFMGRDPEDGDVSNPGTLHRYLFAGGDPVNNMDPSGRDYAGTVSLYSRVSVSGLVIATLQGFSATLGCLELWEAGNTWATAVAGPDGYVLQLPCFALPFSKGGPRNVIHNWVLDMARGSGMDPCAYLKELMKKARKAGDSKTFLAAKATYKGVCRGK